MTGGHLAQGAPVTPIIEDDAFIRSAVAAAELPSLLPALAALTGDLSLLRDDLRPDPLKVREPNGGYTHEQQAAIHELAVAAIVRYRDGGCRPAPPPSDETITRLMAHAVGDLVGDDYVPMMREELSVTGDDLRAPTWHKDALAPDRPFTTVIVGAGMSGLLAGHRLDQAGVPFVIIEKNHDVGGTWLENSYPGCRVDISNHCYSYSFAQRHDWSHHFSTGPVLLDYFRACADDFGLRDRIRFGTEVTAMTYDDERALWTLELTTPDGEATIEANAVVSAVGQLNRPKMPAISGIERFEGRAWHSSHWNHDVDLTGLRVAVIGTGASSVQLVPEIVGQVARLDVYQRTPNWFFPVLDYHDEVAPGMSWLLAHVPGYAQWHRFQLFWRAAEGLLPSCRADADWPDITRSVGAANEELRGLLTMWFDVMFADRPDLLAKVVPPYPPASKRVVLDNGVWVAALKRDNVNLITDTISEITPTGVVTTSEHGEHGEGVEREVDVIIYATGFHASDFLMPMKIVGRGGVELHDRWNGDARAHLGVTIPGCPNLFLCYGPNTNIVVNGSIIYFSECEVHYALGCIELLLRTGAGALDVRPEAHDAFNERVDAGNRAMAWGATWVDSWYKNRTGRVSQNWPFTLLEYWQLTRRPDPSEYDLLG